MDAETIKREAGEAILDLELESSVTHITQQGKNWCVQFEGDYSQFCDSFQNQFERDNSPRVIREKIKKHLLGQITQLRNKGGRRTTKKGFEDERGLPSVTDFLQEAVTETTRALGDVIRPALDFTGTAMQSANEVAETVTTRTSEMVSPPAPPRAPARSTSKRTSPAKAKKAATKRKPAKKRAAAKKRSSKR